MSKPKGPLVDLRMALSYVPGVYCICRCLVLIYFMGFHDLSERISVLLVICVALYCDRNVRHESILDSNAIAATLAVAQLFNLLRIKDVATEEEEFIRVTRGWTRIETLVQVLYCLASLAETCDVSPASMFTHNKAMRSAFAPDKASILTQALLVCGMVFVHLNKKSLEKVYSVSRCACFCIISVAWSYIVGVPTTLRHLHTMDEFKENSSRETDGRLQNIAFVHLRFAYILVVDLPFVLVAVPVQLALIIYKAATIWVDDVTYQRMTHPEFFISQDVITGPFSIFAGVATTVYQAPAVKKALLPLRAEDKQQDAGDDIALQFKLARANAGK